VRRARWRMGALMTRVVLFSTAVVATVRVFY